MLLMTNSLTGEGVSQREFTHVVIFDMSESMLVFIQQHWFIYLIIIITPSYIIQ